MLKKIFRSSIIAFINALISVIAIPIVLTFVGLEGVGYYGMLITLSGVLSFMDFGSGKFLMNSLSVYKLHTNDDDRINLILLVEYIFVVAFIVILILFSFQIFQVQILLIVVVSLLKVLEQFYRYILIGCNKLNKIELQSLLANVFRWLGLILVANYFEIGPYFLIIWMLIIQIINNIIWRVHITSYFVLSLNLLRKGLQYTVANGKILFNFTYNQVIKIFNTQADKLLLLSFLGVKQFGLYTSLLIIPNLSVAYSEVINNTSRVTFGGLIINGNKEAVYRFFALNKLVIFTSFFGFLGIYFFADFFGNFIYSDEVVYNKFEQLSIPILLSSFLRLTTGLLVNYLFLVNDLTRINFFQTILSILIIASYFLIKDNMSISKLLLIQNISNLLLILFLFRVIFKKLKIYKL